MSVLSVVELSCRWYLFWGFVEFVFSELLILIPSLADWSARWYTGESEFASLFFFLKKKFIWGIHVPLDLALGHICPSRYEYTDYQVCTISKHTDWNIFISTENSRGTYMSHFDIYSENVCFTAECFCGKPLVKVQYLSGTQTNSFVIDELPTRNF